MHGVWWELEERITYSVLPEAQERVKGDCTKNVTFQRGLEGQFSRSR